MKSVSNFKTMREASLPRSISVTGGLVEARKRSGNCNHSRNSKGFIIYPNNSTDMLSPASSTVKSA